MRGLLDTLRGTLLDTRHDAHHYTLQDLVLQNGDPRPDRREVHPQETPQTPLIGHQPEVRVGVEIRRYVILLDQDLHPLQ